MIRESFGEQCHVRIGDVDCKYYMFMLDVGCIPRSEWTLQVLLLPW